MDMLLAAGLGFVAGMILVLAAMGSDKLGLFDVRR